MLYPLNDLCKIQLDNIDEFGFAGGEDSGTAESGILVELPEKLTHFGFWSFAFENSFMNEKDLDKLRKFWEKRLGHRVYWTALSEKGNIIKSPDGQRYAYIKFTSLIAGDDEPGMVATNAHSDGGGSFSV